MKPLHEKLLVATLAGLIITSAAAFAVTPGRAAEYQVGRNAVVTGLAWWEQLDMRKWPMWFSAKVGTALPGSTVKVEWCVTVERASDWCRINDGSSTGWVNAKYLAVQEASAE